MNKKNKERAEVILVDDIMMWRESIIEYFNLKGIDVKETAENGFELLKLLRSKTNLPDIILLDLNMPIMDGSITLDELRVEFPKKKIIITTEYYDEYLIKDFFNRGISAYIPKVSKLELLIEAIFTLKNENVYIKNLSEIFENAQFKNDRYFFKIIYTVREREIIKLICKGLSVIQISNKLFISEKTIETHLTEIYKKAKVSNRYEFLTKAINGRLYLLST